MMKSKLGLLTLIFSIIGCAGSSPRTQNQMSEVVTGDTHRETSEDKALTEWQERKNHSYFDWPVDDARMTRGYLPNRRRPHLGLDLAAPRGTKIFSAQDGTVIYAGRDFRGFGKMIMVEGINGWATLYAHLHEIQVKEGQTVAQGDQIALMGATGRASGVHLHFEIRRTTGPVDPLLYLPGGAQALRLAINPDDAKASHDDHHDCSEHAASHAGL